MARIKTLSPEHSRGIKKRLFGFFRKQYGGTVPGIFKIALVDLRFGMPVGTIYRYLHLRKKSPLSRLQREMLATVVNGLVGGAP